MNLQITWEQEPCLNHTAHPWNKLGPHIVLSHNALSFPVWELIIIIRNMCSPHSSGFMWRDLH